MKSITIRDYMTGTGRTMSSVAKSIGVSRQTLYTWMEQDALVVKTDSLGNVTKVTLDKVLYEQQVER